jgi:hypothetical protein
VLLIYHAPTRKRWELTLTTSHHELTSLQAARYCIDSRAYACIFDTAIKRLVLVQSLVRLQEHFFYRLLTHTGSITLGWTWSPGEPQHYGRHQWAGFIVVLSANLVGMHLPSLIPYVVSSYLCYIQV